VITREWGVSNKLVSLTNGQWVQVCDPNGARVGLLIQRTTNTTSFSMAPGRTAPTFLPLNTASLSGFPTDAMPISRENNRAACESGWWIYCTGANEQVYVSEWFDQEQASG
jgi:hypothetical protein